MHVVGVLALLMLLPVALVAQDDVLVEDLSPQPAETMACGSLQELIDATPSGSVLNVSPCVYREAVVIDRPMTVRGYGATISGQDESGETVRDVWLTVAASDVTVEGFTMRHATNGPQTGAVRVEPGISRFVLRDCDLAYAAGANVEIGLGNESRVENCDIHHAGQLGIHVGGDDENGHGNVIVGNTIRNNNTDGFDPEWEAGGLKATRQVGLRLEGNTVYENAGPGLWCDIFCKDILVAGNTVRDNSHAGIMFEVSTGATITDNRVWGNGWGKDGWGWGAGILVSSSGGARVEGNVVAWNHVGISIVSQDRDDWDHIAHDNQTIDNLVIGEDGAMLMFWAQDWDGDLFRAGSGNLGSGGAYWSGGGSDARVFTWRGQLMDHEAFERTRAGQDSVYLGSDEVRTWLGDAGVPIPSHLDVAIQSVE